MYLLVSKSGRWSFRNGYQVYGNVVWVSSREDAKNYKLVDEKGNDIPFNLDECLKEYR